MTEHKQITIKLDLSLEQWGKRHRATVGAFSAQGSKAQCVEQLKAQISTALVNADLGAVVRVGLADGFVYALHCGFDGEYRISGFRPEPGKPSGLTESVSRTFTVRRDAVEHFDDFIDERAGDELTTASAPAEDGASPEARALARLLGLPANASPAELRRAADRIVGSSRVSKYSYSLADLQDCVGGADPLEVIDRAVETWDRENSYTLEEAEQCFAEDGIPNNGKLDEAVADWLDDPGTLPTKTAAALKRLYDRKPEGDTSESVDPAMIGLIAAVNRRHRLSSAHRRKRLRGHDYKQRVRAALTDKLCEMSATLRRLSEELHHRCELPPALREELGL